MAVQGAGRHLLLHFHAGSSRVLGRHLCCHVLYAHLLVQLCRHSCMLGSPAEVLPQEALQPLLHSSRLPSGLKSWVTSRWTWLWCIGREGGLGGTGSPQAQDGARSEPSLPPTGAQSPLLLSGQVRQRSRRRPSLSQGTGGRQESRRLWPSCWSASGGACLSCYAAWSGRAFGHVGLTQPPPTFLALGASGEQCVGKAFAPMAVISALKVSGAL